MTDIPPWQVILDLGAEGGGCTLLGRNLGGDRWEFAMDGSSIALDEHDDEEWRTFQRGPVTNWEDALNLLIDRWCWFYPIAIHPAFADRIEASWQACVAASGDDRSAQRSTARWQAAFAESRGHAV